MAEARKSLKFFEEKIASTQNIQVQYVLSQLIADSIGTIAISEAKDEYYLKTVDSPKLSFKSLKPSLIVFVIVSGMIGIFITLFWIMLILPNKR